MFVEVDLLPCSHVPLSTIRTDLLDRGSWSHDARGLISVLSRRITRPQFSKRSPEPVTPSLTAVMMLSIRSLTVFCELLHRTPFVLLRCTSKVLGAAQMVNHSSLVRNGKVTSDSTVRDFYATTVGAFLPSAPFNDKRITMNGSSVPTWGMSDLASRDMVGVYLLCCSYAALGHLSSGRCCKILWAMMPLLEPSVSKLWLFRYLWVSFPVVRASASLRLIDTQIRRSLSLLSPESASCRNVVKMGDRWPLHERGYRKGIDQPASLLIDNPKRLDWVSDLHGMRRSCKAVSLAANRLSTACGWVGSSMRLRADACNGRKSYCVLVALRSKQLSAIC